MHVLITSFYQRILHIGNRRYDWCVRAARKSTRADGHGRAKDGKHSRDGTFSAVLLAADDEASHRYRGILDSFVEEADFVFFPLQRDGV